MSSAAETQSSRFLEYSTTAAINMLKKEKFKAVFLDVIMFSIFRVTLVHKASLARLATQENQ